MLIEKLSDYRIFLVSKSPRRASLLQSMGIPFEVLSADVEETYDESLSPEQVAEHLSKIKLTGVQRLD